MKTSIEKILESIGRDEQGRDVSLSSQRETRRRVASLLAEKQEKGSWVIPGLRLPAVVAMAAAVITVLGFLAYALRDIPKENEDTVLAGAGADHDLDNQIDAVRYQIASGLGSFERKLGGVGSAVSHEMASSVGRRMDLRTDEIERELSRHDI